MNAPAELVARILFEGGAVHPDAPPKGLVVVGVPDALWKLEHVRIKEYLGEHPTAPALEASRRVLWGRTQELLAEKWATSGRPAFEEDWDPLGTIDLLEEVWIQNRQGRRLEEFPRALKKYRAAVLSYLGRDPTT